MVRASLENAMQEKMLTNATSIEPRKIHELLRPHVIDLLDVVTKQTTSQVAESKDIDVRSTAADPDRTRSLVIA